MGGGRALVDETEEKGEREGKQRKKQKEEGDFLEGALNQENVKLQQRLVFSVVGLNKTKTRNSLALDGTLSSIMTIKMADLEPCFKWEPPSDVLKASKKDIGQYNRAHRS
ncbi:unnamed protein product [Boreogadus saida]